MNCAERIRKLRLERNMSLEKLAREAGVSVETVKNWEDGTSLPDSGKLLVLSAILGTSAQYLDKGEVSHGKNSASGNRSCSNLCFTAAVILYLAGLAVGEFSEAASLLGTPLIYYGTSPLAVILLAGTVLLVVTGVMVRVISGRKR